MNSQGMKNCKSTESFCRSILAIYTNDWSTFWYVYCCYVYFFSGKFLNVCKPRTITYPFDSLAHLDWYTGWRWWMQAGSVPCNQKYYCKWNLSFFKTVPPNFGSLLHLISSLFNHFRSWDYLEHFEHFQLDGRSKTWFFIFLNVYVSWIGRDKILITQLSSPKFRYFADQNGPKSDPIKMNFDNF